MASEERTTPKSPSTELREAAEYFGKLSKRTEKLATRIESAEGQARRAEDKESDARGELHTTERRLSDAVDRLIALEQHVDDMRLGIRTPAEVIAYARNEAWAKAA